MPDRRDRGPAHHGAADHHRQQHLAPERERDDGVRGTPAAPDARFTWSQRASTLIVDFTDTSTNTPAQWSWNFGDGTTSTQRNPAKTFAAAGPYNVSLTVTNGGGTDSVSHQVTVQAPPAGVTVAADGFGRTVSGWGSADVGGSYTNPGAVADYNVANGVGTMRITAAGATRGAMLNSVSHRDVDISVRIAVDKPAAGGNYFVYAVARRNTNNEYRPRLILNANGSVSVGASWSSTGPRARSAPRQSSAVLLREPTSSSGCEPGSRARARQPSR